MLDLDLNPRVMLIYINICIHIHIYIKVYWAFSTDTCISSERSRARLSHYSSDGLKCVLSGNGRLPVPYFPEFRQ